MNKFAKIALGAAMVAGAATLATQPASARMSVGIGFGVGYPGYYPGSYYGPRHRYYRYCDPYSPYYDPYDCGGDPYYNSYYDGYGYGAPFFGDAVFFDGGWYHGPFRSRYYHGNRWFWVNNGWHRNEWRGGHFPHNVTFRNGGNFSNGRFSGFHGSDRMRAPGDFRNHVRGESSGDRRFNGSASFRGGSVNTGARFDNRSFQGRSTSGAAVRGDGGGHNNGGGHSGGHSGGHGGGHHGH